MAVDTEQSLDWQDDLNNGCVGRLAVTVHLIDVPCCGGTFEIREKDGARLLFQQEVLAPRMLTLFRIVRALHHHAAPMRSGARAGLRGLAQRLIAGPAIGDRIGITAGRRRAAPASVRWP